MGLITLNANDSIVDVATTFNVTVVEATNESPIWLPFPNTITLQQGTTVTYDLSDYTSDPDNDSLTYSFEFRSGQGSPKVRLVIVGSVLSITGLRSQGTDNLDEYFLIVSDGEEEQRELVSFRVTDPPTPNRAPVWTGIIQDVTPSEDLENNNIILIVGESLTINFASIVSDPDGDPITLSFSPSDTSSFRIYQTSNLLVRLEGEDRNLSGQTVSILATDDQSNSSSGGSVRIIVRNP